MPREGTSPSSGVRIVVNSGISEDDILRYAKEMIAVPSPTGQEAAVAKKIAELMKEFSDDVALDEHSNVLCVVKGKRPGKTILISTHTDTLHSSAPGEAPGAKIADGKEFGKTGKVLLGPGAAAPKGALAAMLAAGKALAQSKDFAGQVVVAGYVQDLSANHIGVITLLETLAKREIKVDAIVLGEPSDNVIVLGARGRMEIRITVKGKPTHAGSPDKGVNAVEMMAYLISSLRDLQLLTHPHLPAATVSVIEVSSSAVRPRTPHECVAVLDRRMLPGETPEGVIAGVQDVITKVKSKHPELDADVKEVKVLYPLEISPKDPEVAKVRQVAESVSGRKQGDFYANFSANAGYTKTKLGIPSVPVGPGRIEDIGQDHVEISKLVEGAKIYEQAALALLA